MILWLYTLRYHIGPFFFGACTVLFLFVLQFVMNNIDKLLGKGLDVWVIIQVIALNLAWMVVLSVPMGVLFASLMAYGSMSSSHEITIYKAAGGSLYRMMIPSVFFGTTLFIALLWFNDRVLPDANHMAKILMQDIQRKKPTLSIESGQFITQLEGYTILSRNVDSSSGALYGVTIYDNTQNGKTNIVSADTGTLTFTRGFSHLLLTLSRGEIHSASRSTPGDYRVISFSKHQLLMPARDFIFTRSGEGTLARGDREMSIADMQKIVDEARGEQYRVDSSLQQRLAEHAKYLAGIIDTNEGMGYSKQRRDAIASDQAMTKVLSFRSSVESLIAQRNDQDSRARSYLVEIHKKYSIPFACFVFVLVGCPLGIATRRGNFGVSAAISLGFYIFLWASLISGEKLADRSIISPQAGMWAGNVLVLLFAIVLAVRINNETFSLRLPFRRKSRPT